jgi:hypothetical protein
MADLMLLERLEEVLVAPPVELPSVQELPPIEEIRAQAEGAIRNSKGWLNNVIEKVSRARKHKDHRSKFGAVWAQLEPSWSRAIEGRESLVRRMDALLAEIGDSEDKDACELRDILQSVNVHIVREHHTLVKMYYTLKADADNAASDTRGRGKPLSSSEDLKAYFKRIRAA